MAILRVREAFSAAGDPSGRVYAPGDLVDEKNPVVKGRESLFEPTEVSAERDAQRGSVEVATAAPGEKRSVSPQPAKKAAKKAAAKKPGASE